MPRPFGILPSMSGLNKVMLIGRLGRDPETRWFEGGRAMSVLSIATSERHKDQDGNLRERTEWHRVVLWRQLAEVAEKHLSKGDRVYIEGKLKTRNWQDGGGVEHRTVEVVADRLDMLGSPIRTESDAGSTTPDGPHPMDASALPL